MMKDALFYESSGTSVRCGLCSHNCKIQNGKRGLCGVRENVSGVLKSLVYGKLVAMHLDPIEKKPLYHFLPGSSSFSIATVGCNFRCLHCQNYEISQMPSIEERIEGRYVEPSVVVEEALKAGAESISYTYTEPAVFYEYALDVASLAREAGLKNVFVSNGYMTEGAIRKIAPLLDAVNVDLKGDDQFYRKVCGAKQQPVKECISLLFTLGVWVEVTTLLIPGYNDSDGALKEIASFLAGVSKDIPWHVSAFHPMYRLMDAPPTRSSDLRRGISAGKQAGLRYVYAGNMPGEGDDTACPCCGNVLIERSAFRVMRNSIVDGRCGSCGLKIAGVW